ncbi:MAG: hypothetical protein COZ66_01640 [Candidatus Huberarchaeum crystalense]|nr:hypothetical protein [archaeon]OIP20412.1 MAG: hypothetical protein AUJ91_01305 [archaeon CG2_30_31_98]PIV13580.1 MAG: hypothetical protein COS45_02170 [Candidatus Huberarchaeum crystalense]NCS98488.1 hypothetical protein [archaeon]PIX28047.1 MAG: hypothetical protein COZ66_01640 [Candidatus Huberarchaeum crystalense]
MSKQLATQYTNEFLNLAKQIANEQPERAARYVEICRKIATAFNIRLSKRKREFCKQCNAYLTPKCATYRLLKIRGRTCLFVKCAKCRTIKKIILK